MRHDVAMFAEKTSLSGRLRAGLLPVAGVVLSTGCATVPPAGKPTLLPPPSSEAQPVPAPASPSGAGSGPSPISPPVATTAGSADSGSPPRLGWPNLRLPWVNPARCLSRCAAEPPEDLLRVNPQGQDDPKGRLRIARPIVEPLRALLAAAREVGHALRIESAYRSYSEQERLFASVKEIGRAARPGHSEHQLGTTVDLRIPTGAGITWLAAHAAEHGFALSYPAGKQRVTGYRPEPWHIRYVGRELAQLLKDRGLILEEAFRAQPSLGESGSCSDCPSPASRADCGAVTAGGQCQGSVLSFCYDGVLTSVDCALSAETCGPAASPAPPAGGDAVQACVPAPKPAVSLNLP